MRATHRIGALFIVVGLTGVAPGASTHPDAHATPNREDPLASSILVHITHVYEFAGPPRLVELSLAHDRMFTY